MRKIEKFSRGMGIGGWLTNYKRFNVLPEHMRLDITIGDLEHFDTYITENDIKYIASLGIDHVRLGFDQIVLESEPYVYRERIIELLRSFVSWCQKYNMRPIFNLHKAIGNYCDIIEETSLLDSQELQKRFIALWVMLENEFHDDNEIMFELLNEVRDVPTEGWISLADKTVNAIRALNSERYIIIGGAWWNHPNELNKLKVYDDDYIIYTFHNYDPSEFTHQRGVLHYKHLYYNRVLDWPTNEVDKYRLFHKIVYNNDNAYEGYDKLDIEYLRKVVFAPVCEFIKNNPDKIVWCGEFGTIRHANIKSRENFMRDMITLLKEYDVPYSVWNYLSTPNDGNRFSLVDDDNRKILSPTLAEIIKGNV